MTNMCKVWEEQRKIDRKEGRNEVIQELLRDGLLTPEEAAKRLRISEQEVEKLMK